MKTTRQKQTSIFNTNGQGEVNGRNVPVKVMDATYLGIRSAHERVWLVEWKSETDMAASSIFDDRRSRTSER